MFYFTAKFDGHPDLMGSVDDGLDTHIQSGAASAQAKALLAACVMTTIAANRGDMDLRGMRAEMTDVALVVMVPNVAEEHVLRGLLSDSPLYRAYDYEVEFTRGGPPWPQATGF